MSVNISVREGDTSRTFSNVDKITVNLPGGGTTDFIPENEADDYATTTTLIAHKNGTYRARDANAVGYSEVKVEVASAGGSIDEGNIVESLKTNISSFALIPKIRQSTTSYEWIAGRDEGNNPVRTFSSASTQQFREYISIAEKNAKMMFEQLIKPSDYANITEDETSLLTTEDGKQVYFVSIADFSKGFTTISPRSYNDKISVYVEDMYKCRRLKSANNSKELIKIYSNTAAVNQENETVFQPNVGMILAGIVDISFSETTAEKIFKIGFTSATGTEYGYAIKESKDNGEVQIIDRRNNNDFPNTIVKPYSSVAEMEEDKENLPVDSVGIIKAGG